MHLQSGETIKTTSHYRGINDSRAVSRIDLVDPSPPKALDVQKGTLGSLPHTVAHFGR